MDRGSTLSGGVAAEESRESPLTAPGENHQPRTHCEHCGTRLTRGQRESGNRYCSRDCTADAAGWRRTPAEARCSYCGKALTYEQRKGGGRYCEGGHANKHRRWPSIWAEWAEMNEYLETRDRWERIAPRMQGKREEIRDWHIRQMIREETSRGLMLGKERR